MICAEIKFGTRKVKQQRVSHENIHIDTHKRLPHYPLGRCIDTQTHNHRKVGSRNLRYPYQRNFSSKCTPRPTKREGCHLLSGSCRGSGKM